MDFMWCTSHTAEFHRFPLVWIEDQFCSNLYVVVVVVVFLSLPHLFVCEIRVEDCRELCSKICYAWGLVYVVHRLALKVVIMIN